MQCQGQPMFSDPWEEPIVHLGSHSLQVSFLPAGVAGRGCLQEARVVG